MSESSIRGLEDVLEVMNEIADIDTYKKALGKACALVERAAKKKAPKVDGTLRRSITSKIEVNGNNLEGVVYTPLEYAPYVEFGTGLFAEKGGRKDVPWHYKNDDGEWVHTKGQHPQPFIRPALTENRENIMRILKEGLSQ